MLCSECRKPIVLVPSAAERAARYGGKPSDYVKLFPMHAACAVAKRSKASGELMRRLTEKAADQEVYLKTNAQQ